MGLKQDPFPLIFTQGDEVTRLACLALFGLEDSPVARACLLQLIKQQRSDGTFPSRLDTQQWGMRETVRNTFLLLKVGLPAEGVNVDSAVRSVLRHQRPDGGWCENPALALPPQETWLSNERSITWLTADVVDLLRQAGMGESAECQAAVAWLRAMQNRHGGWPSLAGEEPSGRGDPDATAQITFLMGEIYGQDDPVYQKGQALFERNLDKCAGDVERGYWIRWDNRQREELDAYTLTHMLLSWLLDPPRRLQHGYDVHDSRVKAMMEALVDIQLEAGGWRPFWAEESDPVYTVLALKALILSGALAREELQASIEQHSV